MHITAKLPVKNHGVTERGAATNPPRFSGGTTLRGLPRPSARIAGDNPFRGGTPNPRVDNGGQPFGERAKSWTTLTAPAAQSVVAKPWHFSLREKCSALRQKRGTPPAPLRVFPRSPFPLSPHPPPPVFRWSVIGLLIRCGEIVETFSLLVTMFTYTKQLLRTLAVGAYCPMVLTSRR